MNISMVSEEMICASIFFFHFFCIMDSMATYTNEQWAKYICLKNDFVRIISIKVLSKYLQLLGNKFCFSGFPVISQWKT